MNNATGCNDDKTDASQCSLIVSMATCNATAGCSGGSSSTSGPEAGSSSALRAVTLTLYMTIFIFGVLGNTLTIYVIGRLYAELRQRRATGGRRNAAGSGGGGGTGSQSVSNVYILNLAAADLLFLLTLPLFCYMTWARHWTFGELTCKLALSVRETNKYASVLILVALSVDRCLATFHRVSIGWRQTPVAVVVCLGIWVVCLAGVGGPPMAYGQLVAKGGGRYDCRFSLPWMTDSRTRRTWTLAQLALNVIIPFAIIVAVNIVLLRRLRSFAAKSSNRSMTTRLRQLPVAKSNNCDQFPEYSDGRMENADEQVRSKCCQEIVGTAKSSDAYEDGS